MTSAAMVKMERGVRDALARGEGASSARADDAVELSIDERLALSKRLRAMTPLDAPQEDSTLIIRWYRDTNGGRWTDDGWDDDDGR